MGEMSGGFIDVILFVLAILFGILWIVLYLAVLGIRKQLDQVIRLMEKKQNTVLTPGISSTEGAPTKDETSQTQVIEKSR